MHCTNALRTEKESEERRLLKEGQRLVPKTRAKSSEGRARELESKIPVTQQTEAHGERCRQDGRLQERSAVRVGTGQGEVHIRGVKGGFEEVARKAFEPLSKHLHVGALSLEHLDAALQNCGVRFQGQRGRADLQHLHSQLLDAAKPHMLIGKHGPETIDQTTFEIFLRKARQNQQNSLPSIVQGTSDSDDGSKFAKVSGSNFNFIRERNVLRELFLRMSVGKVDNSMRSKEGLDGGVPILRLDRLQQVSASRIPTTMSAREHR